VDGNDFIWRFTPSRTEPKLLEEIFVQRETLLADIVERVREGALTGDKHQTLLIGPRGIGKTHLIALLHHRVTKDPAIAEKVRIAWFLEDETITSFVQLLKRIYELLAEEYPEEFPKEWLEALLDRPPAKILKALEKALIDKFRGKTLLLFIENLDLIFDGLKDQGQKQWRSFLQTHPFTSVVATSQRLFNSVKSRDQPFFGFFATTHLKPLPTPDAVDLLCRIARHRGQGDLIAFLATPEGRSRVRALHHLAGGNHRIYIVLSGFITRESLDELSGPFEKMADELTPYYQERMRWLSAQQRQIVEYLCAQEGSCTPKEIARHLLAAENTISGQLKKLLEFGYVLRNPRGREALYELAEPLMRLASEVKGKRRKPLRLLVTFLRIWYRPDVLPQLLAKAGTPSLRAYLKAAISQSRTSPDPRLKILETEVEKAKQENRLGDLLQILEECAHARGSSDDWFELAWYHDELKNIEAAILCLDKALEIEPRHTAAWNNKGYALDKLGRHEEAIGCQEKALEIDPQYETAWINKAFALNELGRPGEAIGCLDKVLEIDPRHAGAWCQKGSLFDGLGHPKEAIGCFDKALRIDPRHIGVLTNKGHALSKLGRSEAARKCYERALELDSTSSEWTFDRSELRFALRRWEDGFTALREVFERRPQDMQHDINAIIELILRLSEGGEELRRHLTSLIAIYREAGVLAYLGDGLVRSLRRIDPGRVGPEMLGAWRDSWLELGDRLEELEIPLRIFRVGIEYRIRGDEKMLLDLVTVERSILRQALGLDASDGVE